MTPTPIADPVVAVAHLADRGGASEVEVAYRDDRGWFAWVQHGRRRIAVEGHSSAVAAAWALAERLLTRAICRCTKTVTLTGDSTDEVCRWRLMGDRWQPGCDVAPLSVDAPRDDLAAVVEAMAGRVVEFRGSHG